MGQQDNFTLRDDEVADWLRDFGPGGFSDPYAGLSRTLPGEVAESLAERLADLAAGAEDGVPAQEGAVRLLVEGGIHPAFDLGLVELASAKLPSKGP